MRRSPAGPRFGFVWWWDLFALLRGVSIAVLLVPMMIWSWDLNHDFFGPYDWGSAVWAAFLLNKPLAVIDTCTSIGMAIRARVRGMPIPMRRHLFSVVVRAFCGMLPLFVLRTCQTLNVSDRCYLARHVHDLQAVVDGADPKEFGYMDAYRHEGWTIIQAINLNISDCYWIIYSPGVDPSEWASKGGGWDWALLHATHIEGPWYSAVF